MKRITVLLTMFALLAIACQSEKKVTTPKPDINYPVTNKIDHVYTYHGVEVPDPLRWLEDDRSEETGAWVKAQNDVTFGYLNSIPFKAELQSRIEKLNDYEKISAPFKEGAYEYFYKNDGLQDHSIVYRTKLGETDAKPEIFLNPNDFSTDGTTALRGINFTKDGTISAHI